MDYGLTEERLEEFFWWMHERQGIFRRRFVEGQDEPWTDDPYLRDRHFCNVYRELDRVSRWYINEYVGKLDPEEALLTTTIFRIVNEPDTMGVIGSQDPESYDADEVTNRVLAAEENGTLGTTFNSAYMITGAVGESGERKIKSYARECWGELADNIDEYWEDHFGRPDGGYQSSPELLYSEGLSPKTTADKWTTQLTELPGVSEFIAYEIYCDMTYHDWFPYTENDYVNTGPGANRGINWIRQEDQGIEDKDELKRSIEKTHTDTVEVIHWLRDNQDEYLDDDFYYWEGKELTLRAIEHSLCEYDKWHRLKWNDEHGESQRMKRHTPHSEPLGIEDEAEQMSDTGLGQF